MKRFSFAAAILLLTLFGASCETALNPETGETAAPRGSNVLRPARETPIDLTQEGEAEMKALARAYPQRIDEVAFRLGQWAVRIDDTWYHWAEGRLLPEELRDRWQEFTSYRFHSYPLTLPPIRELDEESKERLKRRLEQSAESPPVRHQGFLADLYGAATRAQTEAQIVSVEVLGFEARVHRQVSEALRAVNRDLEVLLESDPGVRRFAAGLKGVAGYNWREIAGTRSRSYHSYGIALDLVPRSYGGRHAYWRWLMARDEEWYATPYEKRWMVPLQIVERFEAHGFIWGGKWFFFDTMHFEYRPEILILASNAAGVGKR